MTYVAPETVCRCGHPYRDHGGITLGGTCQAGGCDLCEAFEIRPAALYVVFDGPPSHESGRFVEVEMGAGVSLRVGEWIERPDGYWALRIDPEDLDRAARAPSPPDEQKEGAMSEPRIYTVELPGSSLHSSRSEDAVLKRDYDALAADLAAANQRAGEAEALLGEIGAGGTPAGLVGATHNLILMYKKALEREQALRKALRRIVGHEIYTSAGDPTIHPPTRSPGLEGEGMRAIALAVLAEERA